MKHVTVIFLMTVSAIASAEDLEMKPLFKVESGLPK